MLPSITRALKALMSAPPISNSVMLNELDRLRAAHVAGVFDVASIGGIQTG
jgi:hypothetical protein